MGSLQEFTGSLQEFTGSLQEFMGSLQEFTGSLQGIQCTFNVHSMYIQYLFNVSNIGVI